MSAVVAAVVGGVAAVGGAVIQANAAKDAANTQSEALGKSLAFQQQMYQTSLANNRPYMQGGEGSMSELRYLFGQGKPGVGMLAVTSGAPVVPAYVSGTLEALPKGAAWPRRSQVSVSFGPALHFKPQSGAGRKDRYREAAEEMMRGIAQLREEEEKTHSAPH